MVFFFYWCIWSVDSLPHFVHKRESDMAGDIKVQLTEKLGQHYFGIMQYWSLLLFIKKPLLFFTLSLGRLRVLAIEKVKNKKVQRWIVGFFALGILYRLCFHKLFITSVILFNYINIYIILIFILINININILILIFNSTAYCHAHSFTFYILFFISYFSFILSYVYFPCVVFSIFALSMERTRLSFHCWLYSLCIVVYVTNKTWNLKLNTQCRR